MKFITLRQAIDNNASLSQEHLNNFKKILLKGMRSPQRKRVLENLTFQNLAESSRWWQERMVFYEDGRCRYVPGQDETVEIPMIRNELIDKFS